LRFALTGGLAGLLQLGLLEALTAHGWHSLAANPAAFLLAAQVNFALSTLFTWRDRHGTHRLWRRWLLFHGSIFGMAVLNIVVFAAARLHVPDLAAAALGIIAAAIGNFLLGDRLVFRGRSGEPASDVDDFEEFVA
jgi:putative flippase GtrA